MDTTLKALLEIHRRTLLLAKLNPQTGPHIDDALVYATSHRLCPVFHLDAVEDDPFFQAWQVPGAFVEAVLEFCDELWLAKKPLTFGGTLEGKFGRDKRSVLIEVMRYAFLAGHFDDTSFWEAFLEMCPAEAKGVNRPFDVSEIAFP